MSFKDYDIKISYKSVGEMTISDIVNPLLSEAKYYWRSVGFFSSSSLNFIGDGLLNLAKNGGKICLATCPRLSNNDIEAIKAGYEARELLQNSFISEFENTLSFLDDYALDILYQLIKECILDIKIVIKKDGIYHDKLAIIEDFDGNKIAFVGSANESEGGYHDNYEKIRVYKSWTDLEGRIDDETDEFMTIWNKTNSFLDVYDFMPAIEAKVIEIQTARKTSGRKKEFTARPYQDEAKARWIENNYQGFFVMATGTGKTKTSLYSIKELIFNNKVFTVIVAPYKHLVSQWSKEAKEFFPNAYIQMVNSEIDNAESKIFNYYLSAKNSEYKPIIVITTNISFFLDRFAKLYDKIEFDKLLIVDEAHNFINSISSDLSNKYKYKLGLSATPVFGTDESKTKRLLEWFGGQVADYPIEKAIGKYLVNYEYHPIYVNATKEDEDDFNKNHQNMIKQFDKNGNIKNQDLFNTYYRGRLRAISMAKEKIEKMPYIYSKIMDTDHTIIYCSDGKLFYEDSKKKNDSEKEIRHLEYILKLINQSIITTNPNLKASKFTASEDLTTRMRLIDDFSNGDTNYLVAIRCLDEGIDIPSIKSALILSSNDNYREFVQRRGRILRLNEGKNIAHIYDVIVLPSENNKAFATIEFRRFNEYMKLAINKDDLKNEFDNYLDYYGLTDTDILFKNEYVNGGDLDE